MTEEIANYNQPSTQMPPLGDFRRDARAALSGHWVNAVLCTLVCTIITSLCSAFVGNGDSGVLITVSLVLTFFLAVPLQYGYVISFLRHVRGEEDDDLVTRPFAAFRSYGRYMPTSTLVAVLVVIGSVLFVVPGVILALAYSMTPFIMHDNPDLSPVECLKASREMMKGYKWKLFLLMLSFILWLLLCVVTLGIAYLWVNPWMNCTEAKFYEYLRSRQ